MKKLKSKFCKLCMLIVFSFSVIVLVEILGLASRITVIFVDKDGEEIPVEVPIWNVCAGSCS